MAAFLSHWADTISDSLVADTFDKTFKTGGLPETIPDITGGYDADASWSSVWPTTVYTVWKSYGDAHIVGKYWQELMLYVNHTVGSFAGGDIKGIFHTWGDWCVPPAVPGTGQGPKPKTEFTAGVSFLLDLQHLVEMATATASPDLPRLQALYNNLVAQFNADWLVANTYYGSSPTDGAQTAQACALALGIVPPASQASVADYLVNDIALHNGAMSVGIIGNKFLHRALTATGQAWLAANISMQTEYPSFGWTFNHPDEPATTLWELWDGPNEGPGMNSRNHIMEGAIGAFLFSDIAGIAQQPGSAGYTDLLLWPRVTVHESLPFASATYASIAGSISVSWANATSAFTLAATVPLGVRAEVRLAAGPGASAGALVGREGGVTFFQNGALVPGAVSGITSAAVLSVQGGASVLAVHVVSGSYAFNLTGW